MNSKHCVQDALRCNICETNISSMYCDICHYNLCKACVGEHFSDISSEHKVVPFEQRGSTVKYPDCKTHPNKVCELQCEQCYIPICTLCVASGEHDQHQKEDVLKTLACKKERMQEDLQELEKLIRPQYQKAASNIPVQKDDLRKHSQKLKTALDKHGETWHREINTIVKRMQSKIGDMDSKHMAAINKQEDAINQMMTEVSQSISELRKLLDSSDFYRIFAYTSRNEEFRRLPAQFQVTLPTFTSYQINREKIYEQFGFLSELAITTEEQDDQVKTPWDVTRTEERPLIDDPQTLIDIKTASGKHIELFSVSCCLSDNEIWTRGNDKIMRLYNLQGELLKSIQTASGNCPLDITVTQSEDLVYTDLNDRSVNIVKNPLGQSRNRWWWGYKTQIHQLIRLQGWRPLYLCSRSFAGDILISMISDDKKQTKVGRYSDSTEKQSIQWDDQGQPLYTAGAVKYLSENRNLNICVADYDGGAVVVVNADGQLRFRYTGPPSSTKGRFCPVGITTDSQGRILTSDPNNQCIHIVDQDGHFLRYIDYCGLLAPWGLCLDSNDNLFVAERFTGHVKKILYK